MVVNVLSLSIHLHQLLWCFYCSRTSHAFTHTSCVQRLIIACFLAVGSSHLALEGQCRAGTASSCGGDMTISAVSCPVGPGATPCTMKAVVHTMCCFQNAGRICIGLDSCQEEVEGCDGDTQRRLREASDKATLVCKPRAHKLPCTRMST